MKNENPYYNTSYNEMNSLGDKKRHNFSQVSFQNLSNSPSIYEHQRSLTNSHSTKSVIQRAFSEVKNDLNTTLTNMLSYQTTAEDN